MKKVCIICFICFLSLACRQKKPGRLFSKLESAESGVSFVNTIVENDATHSFINEFGYMGGGVGIGDFNNDGLKDIFFSGNQVSCAVYINKGNNHFEDISHTAGIQTNVWCTGVSVVDINHDGYDDVYVCVFGKDLSTRSPNLLFVNQRNGRFKEEAQSYGLADTGYSTQAAFLDYDRDGDLDMYLTNYLLSARNTNAIFPRDLSGRSAANDRLFRNDGDISGAGHPVFTDVSMSAGIREDGYGLGVVISDLNQDGWPDIYVANDFVSNDVLWLNNRDGTFTNRIATSMQHQAYSSMGADAADINNDGLADVLTVDMLPEINERKKTSFSFMNYERYEAERAMGYEPEFMRNMLQLNRGVRNAGDTSIPFFSEIGQLSGIQATDWSWSALVADFDNDGWKDIHITNGIGRDFIDADFLEFSSNVFNSNRGRAEQERAIRDKLASLDHVELPNYLYINQQDLRFGDRSEEAGINEASMSNGAAYADLDNDGDLDLVINNINKPAFLFINNTRQKTKPAVTHFLSIRLQGNEFNTHGIGAMVFLYRGSQVQMQEHNPVRGYFSSVDDRLLFGLGKSNEIDSLHIIWPDGKQQRLAGIQGDTTLFLSWKDANALAESVFQAATLFSDITATGLLNYQHTEGSFNDYTLQRLLPQKFSQLGPSLSIADINGDGASDVFIGGAFNFPGKIFTQKGSEFDGAPISDSIKFEEDTKSVFFDADGDDDADLLVTGGDMQYPESSPYYKPRLYLNDGKGNFQLNPLAMNDSVKGVAGCVAAGDYDGDGDADLFIGGRVSRNYPLSPRSFLLQNNKGVFTDVTAKVCPELVRAGMVTAAVWADVNNDRKPELIIAGEWMPLRFFKTAPGQLTEMKDIISSAEMHGMWRSLIAADIDNDGDMDLVAGNMGLNTEYRASKQEPMELFAADIDGNGSLDPVMFYYIKDSDGKKRSYPAISRNRFSDQVPGIKKKFLAYKDYATATATTIFTGAKDKRWQWMCDETRSCFFENDGNGRFIKHVLPVEAQLAPVNAIICEDLDGDGIKDLVLAGNEYQSEVNTGRYDASYGCLLKGNKDKTFSSVSPVRSGFIITGDVKDLSLLSLKNGDKLLLAAVNNGRLKVFRVNGLSKKPASGNR